MMGLTYVGHVKQYGDTTYGDTHFTHTHNAGLDSTHLLHVYYTCTCICYTYICISKHVIQLKTPHMYYIGLVIYIE